MRNPVWKVVTKARKSYFSMWSLESEEFILTYNDGDIVKSIKNSLGIFCFKTKSQAVQFISKQREISLRKDFDCMTIIKVEPLHMDIGKVPKEVGYHPFVNFYLGIKNTDSRRLGIIVPEGTICYPTVKVIGEAKFERI